MPAAGFLRSPGDRRRKKAAPGVGTAFSGSGAVAVTEINPVTSVLSLRAGRPAQAVSSRCSGGAVAPASLRSVA